MVLGYKHNALQRTGRHLVGAFLIEYEQHLITTLEQRGRLVTIILDALHGLGLIGALPSR